MRVLTSMGQCFDKLPDEWDAGSRSLGLAFEWLIISPDPAFPRLLSVMRQATLLHHTLPVTIFCSPQAQKQQSQGPWTETMSRINPSPFVFSGILPQQQKVIVTHGGEKRVNTAGWCPHPAQPKNGSRPPWVLGMTRVFSREHLCPWRSGHRGSLH